MPSNFLDPGGIMNPGDTLTSPNGKYVLAMGTSDFTLTGPGVSWSSSTNSVTTNFLIMQSDGNLVLYDPNSHALWASNTAGKGGTFLVVQDDGNMVLYQLPVVWSTGTAQ